MSEPLQTDDFMAMKGAGYYSKATIGAKHVMDNAASLILDALERMDPAGQWSDLHHDRYGVCGRWHLDRHGWDCFEGCAPALSGTTDPDDLHGLATQRFFAIVSNRPRPDGYRQLFFRH